ncbi:MAG: PAS domain-containing protein [Gaiellaceae bacterium]|jgi:DNA-directed RNA polymerase subunit RPC12/RpoP
MPLYICPNCKQRSVDVDGLEGFNDEPVACRSCGFGFLFELMEDYYPSPNTGLVTCDQEGRAIAVGRGIFELSGYDESDLIGRDVREGLGLKGDGDQDPIALALEWGVRRLGEPMTMRAHSGHEKGVVCDFFPAYDDDGGLLVALTPTNGT